MAGVLRDTFVPCTSYNALPLIGQVAEAPDKHSGHLQDLRQLLRKHNVPEGVSVRLIHRHFDAAEGEIMVLDKLSLPGHGSIQVLKPVVAPQESGGKLRGIHYYVDDDAALQAYEYGTSQVPDMAGFEPFLTEFCRLVSERGLQRKFGLKLQCEEGEEGGDDGAASRAGWTEYELHSKRSTIMFPDGMPMPDGQHKGLNVTTEWKPVVGAPPRVCGHTKVVCKHCTHRPGQPLAEETVHGFCLGGQEIVPGNPVYDIVHQIVVAAF